ncbi:hypothetical protein [Streptosporangium roseum]|uniref:hypothetical protein n=1 Tax=Streptosporangium roseum TaxID=2001 RepID=UPI0033262D1D
MTVSFRRRCPEGDHSGPRLSGGGELAAKKLCCGVMEIVVSYLGEVNSRILLLTHKC